MKSKIFNCYLLGGLGNQIFQNVFLDWIRKNHIKDIIVSKADYLHYKNKLRNQRKIQSLYFNNWINKGNVINQNMMISLRIKYRLNKILPSKYRIITDKFFIDYLDKNKKDFFNDILLFNCMKAHCIMPQIISYEEFNSSWIDILKRFKNEEKNLNLTTQMDNYDIVIHLRRGDYLNFPNLYYELTKSYFNNAIDLLKEKLKIYGNPSCLVIGNDINWAKENIGKSANCTYQFKTEFEDFRELLNANNLIISNSSFSLSAAMLGMHNRTCQNVVSPISYYKGKNDIGPIAHKSWSLVDNDKEQN